MNETFLLYSDNAHLLDRAIRKLFGTVSKLEKKSKLFQMKIMLFDDAAEVGFRDKIIEKWNTKCEISFINTSDLYSKYGFLFKRDFLSFVRKFPESLVYKNKSFNDIFERDGASLWQFTELSQLNSAGNKVYWKIFQCYILKSYIVDNPFEKCFIYADDQVVRVLVQYFNQINFSYCILGITSRNHTIFKILKALLFYRFANMVQLIFATLKSKQFASNHPHKSNNEQADYVAFSWFPRVWKKNNSGKQVDMYYDDKLDEVVSKISDQKTTLALRLYDNSKGVTPGVFKSRMKKIVEWGISDYRLLEFYGNLSEILRKYLNFSDACKFMLVSQTRSFNQNMVFSGMDLREILLLDFWRSVAIRWPENLLLAARTKALIQNVKPHTVFLYCFEYLYGRAIVWGAKSGGCKRVIGLQHGPVGFFKFKYDVCYWRPGNNETDSSAFFPDLCIVDSPFSRDILVQSGVPNHKICITGPVRFENSMNYWKSVRSNSKSYKSDNKINKILIAPGHSDTAFCLKIALESLASQDELELIIKLHPKIRKDISDIIAAFDNSNAKIKLTKNDIYECFQACDLVIGTYSSVLPEAARVGLPIIQIRPQKTPDMSVFWGEKTAIKWADTPDKLRNIVHEFMDDSQLVAEYIDLVREEISYKFFNYHDEKPSQKIIVALNSAKFRMVRDVRHVK